jgi:hypothetical protein
VDSEIYICSIEVLNAFQENFMYNSIRDDFMKELLFSEIKEEAIHVYEAENDELCMRIKNPRLFYVAVQLLL